MCHSLYTVTRLCIKCPPCSCCMLVTDLDSAVKANYVLIRASVLVDQRISTCKGFQMEYVCVVEKNEMGDGGMTEIDGRCRALTGVAREAHWRGDIWPDIPEVSHTEVWVKSLWNKRNSRDKGHSRDKEQRKRASTAGEEGAKAGQGWGLQRV